MTNKEINAILIKYNDKILQCARSIRGSDVDDNAQYIRLHILKYIAKFNPEKASMDAYISVMVQTAKRRIIFDAKKQDIFEESFDSYDDLSGELDQAYSEDHYDILDCMLNSSEMCLLTVLTEIENKDYLAASKRLGMKYEDFMVHFMSLREKLKGLHLFGRDK